MNDQGTKTCKKCGETKPRTEFYHGIGMKDGRLNTCKLCYKAYHQENKEKKAEYDKAYKQKNREKIAEYRQEYKQKNREKIAEQQKTYYQENKEKILEYAKAYKQENKEKYVENQAKRRARKRNSVPKFLRDCPLEKQRLVNIYKLREVFSKATGVEYHVDHMWPLSDGGPHWSGNLQLLTAEENMSKNAYVCPDIKVTIKEALRNARQSYQVCTVWMEGKRDQPQHPA